MRRSRAMRLLRSDGRLPRFWRPARRRRGVAHAHATSVGHENVRARDHVGRRSVARRRTDASVQRLRRAGRRAPGPKRAWRDVDQVCDTCASATGRDVRARRADECRLALLRRVRGSQGRWGTIHVWRWRTDETLERIDDGALRAGSGFCKLATSGWERHVHVAWPGEVSGTVDVWDLDGRIKTCSFDGGSSRTDGGAGMCMSLQWMERAHDRDVAQRRLLGTYEDGSVRIWDTRKANEPVACERWHEEAVVASDYEPKKGIVATGSATGELVLARWNHAEAKLVHPVKLKVGDEGIADLAIRPDHKVVAVGSWNGKVHFCALKRPQVLCSATYHTSTVNSVCYSPDGKVLASTSNDRTIALWSLYNAVEK